MKRVVIKTLLLIGITAMAVSCEISSIDEEEKSIVSDIDILSPDKKVKPPGSND
ncbi:hypothetical protein [Flagellimonas aquimarina]|jgi:hypothetical protein|uniref:hypothetical protein n=1 Tax=Flagellimonas aquimarina TaxID=2201895 RepID=UPI0014026940|nr:hypothetical protein [Allomuricauda koreensis]